MEKRKYVSAEGGFRTVSPQFETKIIKKFKSGMSAIDIATEFNKPPYLIRLILNRSGNSVKACAAKTGPRGRSAVEKEKIIAFYNSKYSAPETKIEFGSIMNFGTLQFAYDSQNKPVPEWPEQLDALLEMQLVGDNVVAFEL